MECVYAGYFWNNRVNKKRMCEGVDSVAFWMRMLARFFTSILSLLFLSRLFLSFFVCFRWISVRITRDFFQCGWYFTGIPCIRAFRPCICRGTCMHGCIDIRGYTRVFCDDNNTLDDDESVYRGKTARIILSNKIISRHAELYNQLRSVVLCFFNREQIRVFFRLYRYSSFHLCFFHPWNCRFLKECSRCYRSGRFYVRTHSLFEKLDERTYSWLATRTKNMVSPSDHKSKRR